MIVRRLVLVLVSATLFVACSGGPSNESRVLHLNTGNFAESELRAEVRLDWTTSRCEQVQGLDAADLVAMSDTAIRRGDAATPVQEGVPADRHRYYEIIREECARIIANR